MHLKNDINKLKINKADMRNKNENNILLVPKIFKIFVLYDIKEGGRSMKKLKVVSLIVSMVLLVSLFGTASLAKNVVGTSKQTNQQMDKQQQTSHDMYNEVCEFLTEFDFDFICDGEQLYERIRRRDQLMNGSQKGKVSRMNHRNTHQTTYKTFWFNLDNLEALLEELNEALEEELENETNENYLLRLQTIISIIEARIEYLEDLNE